MKNDNKKAKHIANELTKWLNGKNISVEQVIEALKEQNAKPKEQKITEEQIKETVNRVEKAMRSKNPHLLICSEEDNDGDLNQMIVSAKGTKAEIVPAAILAVKQLMEQINEPIQTFIDGLQYINK